MRVIAGKARRLPLKTVKGLDTRPTTDRIKETLFNILQNEIPGSRFLDLFAGSGAIGIEALSRGAALAVFVEKDRNGCACISENLSFTKLEKDARVICSDVSSALLRMREKIPFDLIFMDPPYERQLERQVLEDLRDSALSVENTMIIVEASLGTSFDDLDGYRVVREKKYKTNKHVFIQKGITGIE